MESAAERIKAKLGRRRLERLQIIAQLENQRHDFPDLWTADMAIRLQNHQSYLSGLDIAYMIVLEETQ
jgi:hypothetical protein